MAERERDPEKDADSEEEEKQETESTPEHKHPTDGEIDEALEESFPASDPPGW